MWHRLLPLLPSAAPPQVGLHLVSWLAIWSVGWLVGWFYSWSVIQSVGELVGWLIDKSHEC